jgi:hypothetical protein
VIDPVRRHRRKETWKRWERGRPMELWQMDMVGGFLLGDGTTAKALTGVDDHSRFCVSAKLMPRERTQPVCDGLSLAMRSHGVPEQILTDNGKVFTGKYGHPPVEVLFDRICRQNGIEHLLTQPRSPTTTGKIERFHRTMRIEFDTTQVFRTLKLAQAALDEWVDYYNTSRPHQSLDDQTPASRFRDPDRQSAPGRCPSSGFPIAPVSSGSAARSRRMVSSASAGSRCPSVSTVVVKPATCWSPNSCCSSGSGTNSSKLSHAKAPDRSARKTPRAPPLGHKFTHGVSRINRTRNVKHQPKPDTAHRLTCINRG